MNKLIKKILKSIGIKVCILLCIAIPLSALIAYCDGVSFFRIMKIMGWVFFFAGIIGFLPSDRGIIYDPRNPNLFIEEKYYEGDKNPYYEKILRNNIIIFSKGVMQVVVAAIIVLALTFLLEAISKTEAFTNVLENTKVKTMIITDEKNYKVDKATNDK